MSFKKLIAAAALAIAGIAGSATVANAAPVTATSASASVLTVSLASTAQRWGDRDDRRYDRGRRNGYDRGRYNRGRHYNRGNRGRTCWKEWRRHQGRVTVCSRR